MGRELQDDYYEVKKGQSHARLLSEASRFLGTGKRALDLGAGALNDAKYLLDLGFEVLAVDKSSRLLGFAAEVASPRLRAVQARFEDFEFPESSFDLVNAQFSLPFMGSAEFPAVFEKMRKSLRPGGLFVGQLFGPNDSWNGTSGMTFHSISDIFKLFGSMGVRYFEEVDKEGATLLGEPKHWHVFYIIAKK